MRVDVAGGQVPQEELDVGPGHKRLADPADHHAADVCGRHRLAKGLVQLEHHGRIERVHRLRTIDVQSRDSIGGLHVQQGKRRGHRQPPFCSTAALGCAKPCSTAACGFAALAEGAHVQR